MSEGKRIKELREKILDINQEAFGAKIHRVKSTISQIENDKYPIEPSLRQSICHVFNVREEWLLDGTGEMFLDKQDSKGVFEIIPNYPGDTAIDDKFVNIPRFSDKISAGGGLIPINDVEIKVAFRRDWIQRKGDPEKMSLISVSGDSMYPTLMAGDLVLINHGQNHLDPQGGLYAIALGDVILIKRLQMLYPSGKVRITSDNEKYDSFDLLQEEVKINGRVIWFGREL